MDLEPGEQVFFHGHPSWRSMLAFYLRGLLLAVLAGVIAGLITRAAGHSVNVAIVAAAVLVVFVLGLIWGLIRRLATTYTITNRRLTIHVGLLSSEMHETRLERIQNVSTRQRVLERLLRVGTVDFDTAGEAGFDFAFRGVDHPRRIVGTVNAALAEMGVPYPRV